jgi:asparagine synthase (glutamine-hydrolysing)
MPRLLGLWCPDAPGIAAGALAAMPAATRQVRLREAQLAGDAQWHASADGVHVLLSGNWAQPKGMPQTSADNPARAALWGYRNRGTALLSNAAGSYALVILDTVRRRSLLAIDRTGIRPLAYGFGPDGRLAFGESALDVATLLGSVRLERQALFDYLHFHMVPSPGTVFSGVSKLEPGCLMEWVDGQVHVRRHWQPDFTRREPDSPALREELRDTLLDSVRSFADEPRTGAFLSGGLDSSTVVGMFAKARGGPVDSFSVGFDAEGYDERQFARIAVAAYGARPHEYVVTPEDVARVVPEIAAAYDEPFGNSSAVPTLLCARLAKDHGMERLLAGDGGDELFAGNPHYTRQQLFEYYSLLPQWLRRGVLEPWVPPITAEDRDLDKLRSYVQQARIPLPRRLHSWNYVFRQEPETLFNGDFLRGIDRGHPDDLMNAAWQAAGSPSALDSMLFFDWKFVLADTDLRKVGHMCALAGIDVQYPMLSDRLIDLSIRVPNRAKIRGQRLRHFYKESLQGFLPDAIINKPKHGFGLPFGVWLKTSPTLGQLVDETLTGLSGRGIFNPALLSNLRDQHRSGHPGYFGYIIWDLLMLEMWLKSHGLAVR